MPKSARPEKRSAFTLLEVIVATMIIGMLATTLYQFVSAHLGAIQTSTELSSEREALQAVVRLLEAQLRDLTPQQWGALRGRPLKFRGLSNDEITWRAVAGPGLLTTAGTGEYWVTLTVQPVNGKSGETELGLRRQLIDPTKAVDTTQTTRGEGLGKYDWLPLIRPVAALEIRYFHPLNNSWQDTWTGDPNIDSWGFPSVVRIRLWQQAGSTPIEALLPVPASHLLP